jgi:hypothetical protein
MTTFTLAWGRDDDAPSGQHVIVVKDANELSAAFDVVAEAANEVHLPQVVDLFEGTWDGNGAAPDGGLQIMIGHPERSWMTWLGDDAALAADPQMPAWPKSIECDRGGQWDEVSPTWLRISSARAREAAMEYVRTGRRPTSVAWVAPV